MVKEAAIAEQLINIITENILASGISERERTPGSITDILIGSIKTKYMNGTFFIYFSKDAVRPSVFSTSTDMGYLPILWNEGVDVTKGSTSKSYGLWKDDSIGDDERSNRYIYPGDFFTSFRNPETRFSHPAYGWMESSLAEIQNLYPLYHIVLNKEMDFII